MRPSWLRVLPFQTPLGSCENARTGPVHREAIRWATPASSIQGRTSNHSCSPGDTLAGALHVPLSENRAAHREDSPSEPPPMRSQLATANPSAFIDTSTNAPSSPVMASGKGRLVDHCPWGVLLAQLT